MTWNTASVILNLVLLGWMVALWWENRRLAARSRCWQRAYEHLARRLTEGGLGGHR